MPHCIIKLSTCEVKRMSRHTIHLGDLFFVNDKDKNTILASYKNVVYGGGVKPTAKYYDKFGIKKRYNQVNLNKIERNYITITGNKKDCIRNC